MNENAMDNSVEDGVRRAAKALSYSESLKGPAPTWVPTVPPYNHIPMPANLMQPKKLKAEVLRLLIDILHLADHEGETLDLGNLIKEAEELHAKEKGSAVK